MARKDRGHICIVFVFAYLADKNPKTLNLSPMANDAITRGGIGGLGSPVYIYGRKSSTHLLSSEQRKKKKNAGDFKCTMPPDL